MQKMLPTVFNWTTFKFCTTLLHHSTVSEVKSKLIHYQILMLWRDSLYMFVCVSLCLRGILCGFNSSVSNQHPHSGMNPHRQTQTNTCTHTKPDWVAKQWPDYGGSFNEDVTVVKTASHFGLDSLHANQLAWVWDEREVCSTDGAYFHVYSFRRRLS